jgi:signal transduction histidine kinase
MPMPAIFRTSVFQLTILYVVLFGVSVVSLGWFIYDSTVGYMARQTQETIITEISGLEERIRIDRVSVNYLSAILEERMNQPGLGRSYYLFVGPDRRVIKGNLGGWHPNFEQVDTFLTFGFNDTSGDEVREIPIMGLVIAVNEFRILVGREISELEQLKRNFQRASILGLGLTMALAFAGGLGLALSSQKRVAELNRTTRRIIAGDLSQRVPIEGGRDEHTELAQSVNTMLDQIEGLMAGLRHVGDSIAHDLRGPLTRLRTRLEQLASEAEPSKESVEECLAQADGVLATFNALLRIARIETGAYRRAFANVDLGLIAHDVAELYEATAEEILVQIRRNIVDGAMVYGDRELLAQALTNLFDNALKFTPAGGHIDLEVRRKGDHIIAVVADSGPGIPTEARERVLERFARLDESRSRPGNGLGLALVRAVADQHYAELALTDNGPGLRVTLSFPAVDAAQASAAADTPAAS